MGEVARDLKVVSQKNESEKNPAQEKLDALGIELDEYGTVENGPVFVFLEQSKVTGKKYEVLRYEESFDSKTGPSLIIKEVLEDPKLRAPEKPWPLMNRFMVKYTGQDKKR